MTLYELLRELKLCRRYLTPQQYRTLKGKALHGDVAGAERGLQRLLWKEKNEVRTWRSK